LSAKKNSSAAASDSGARRSFGKPAGGVTGSGVAPWLASNCAQFQLLDDGLTRIARSTPFCGEKSSPNRMSPNKPL